jgi:hypothetical protein
MFDIKGLVNSLFQSNAQDGVYDLKSATTFIDELPESDILQAQMEIVKALQQLNQNPQVKSSELFKTIPYLDDKATPLQNHLLDLYHGRIIEEGISPHQALPTILHFWQEMATAYLNGIKQASNKMGRSQDKVLQSFAHRATELYGLQARYAYLRHMDVDNSIWRNLNRLYLFAEQNHFATTPFSSPGSDKPFSVKDYYIQILMLSTTNPDKIQSNQISMIVQCLEQWCQTIELETELKPQQHLFAINITASHKPKRIRRDMVGEGWRYWATDTLTQQIKQNIKQLSQGQSPHELGLPEETALAANLDLLQSLSNLWSNEELTPVRQHERQNNNKSIHVITGMKNIIPFILQHTARNSTEQIDAQKWELADISAGGFGLNHANDMTLEVGEFIGLANIGQYPFTVGVVRRINRNQKGQMNVGVETLTQSPVVVTLTPLLSEQSFQCIYAPEGPSTNPARFLIIPSAFFTENREYKFTAQDKSYRIRLSPAMEYSVHFVLAKFAVLEKL